MIKKWLEHKYLNIEVQFIFPLLFTYLHLSIVKYYLKKYHTHIERKREKETCGITNFKNRNTWEVYSYLILPQQIIQTLSRIYNKYNTL